jgi:BirA family biotin operon repressor/biotin-[acetyl-CoA-carboxylase] ligase
MQDDIENYLKNQLNTIFVGKQIYFYPSVTSTMEIARKLAKEGATEGSVVIANKQTSGRGRLDRIWLSPDSNLAMSIILYPPLNYLPKLIMIASVAVVRAIKNITEINAQIKWPNDVMIKGKKVCGILIENQVKGGAVNFSTIGIGINVNLNPVTFPEISAIATSLSYELGREVSRTELACAVLSNLETLYTQSQNGISVYREWQEHMETIGKLIKVQSGESIEQGKAEAITQNGNLILRHPDGSISEILAGDVTIAKD